MVEVEWEREEGETEGKELSKRNKREERKREGFC